MAKGNRRKARGDQFDSSDADSVSSSSTAFSELTLADETEYVNSLEFQLEKCIDALFEKRGSVREAALAGLVNAFEGNVLHTFVENKSVTLLHQCINSIKRGSTKEACLASRAIGLLAITVGAGGSAYEIMEEFKLQLSPSLIAGFESIKKTLVMDCLAVVTFIGANDLVETETSLRTIWNVINPKSGPHIGPVKKPSASVLSSAVSAWSFLLTTIGSWRINPSDWKESIVYLTTLLEDNDRAVRIAAGEALALFLELGLFDKMPLGDEYADSFDLEVSKHSTYVYMRSLRAKVLAHASELSMEAAGKGSDKKNLNDQRDLFLKLMDYFETGECPEITVKISTRNGFLRTSTWAQMIQLNFLKRFLGKGFLKHAQDNELLHEIFEFVEDKTGNLSTTQKKIIRSDNQKWRTLKLNKDRRVAQVRKQGVVPEDA